MKRFLIAAAAVSLGAGSALAADLRARPYTKAPLASVAPVYNWSGFYAGLNGGGGSAHDCWTINSVTVAGLITPINQAEGCHNATGGTVGGQFGYRWQVTNWVFGLEAQGNWANFSGSNPITAAGGPPGALNDVTKVNAFGLFTGQVGYAFNNVMLYAKGGAAVVNDKYSWTLTPLGAALLVGSVAGQTIASGSETRWGGTAGAGIEFGFASHWSIALEYDHLFMGTHSVTQNSQPPLGFGTSYNHSIGQGIDVGTVRVNYTFGGPVVAKY